MDSVAIKPQGSTGVLTTSVRALFLHGPVGHGLHDAAPIPMIAVQSVEAVAGRGLRGDTRFFKPARRGGGESLRQVSLIDEGTMTRHEARFGALPWDAIKAQIFLAGDLRLADLLGSTLVFGEGDAAAVLELTIQRQPCEAMEVIAPGLREAMKDGEQGALARVVRGGLLTVGQQVVVHPRPKA